MAAITATNAKQQGDFAVTELTLTADDTLPFDGAKKQLLVLRNDTAGALTATVDGSDSTSVSVPGLGSVSVAAGFPVAVPAGQSRGLVLSTVSEYCKGVVHLTGAAGLKAQLHNL